MTDPEIEQAVQDAAHALDRRLRPYVADSVRWGICLDHANWLIAERWRPPLRTAPAPARPADPGTTHRGAEMARTALADARRGGTTEGAA